MVLDFVLRPPPFYHAAYHLDVVSVAASDGGAASAHTRPAGPPMPSPATDGTDPDGVASPLTADPATARAAADADIHAIFLVFAPGYLPELLEVVLPTPSSVQSAIAAVSSVRSPASVSRFPHLAGPCLRYAPCYAYLANRRGAGLL